jgi:hypothetical protein
LQSGHCNSDVFTGGWIAARFGCVMGNPESNRHKLERLGTDRAGSLTPSGLMTPDGPRYNFRMPDQYPFSATGQCWTGVLASSALGFVFGILPGILEGKGLHYSPYWFEFSLTIFGGRAFSPRPEPRRLPRLPKAILMALLSSAIYLVIFRRNCAGFLGE